jgi:hypothetical protein
VYLAAIEKKRSIKFAVASLCLVDWEDGGVITGNGDVIWVMVM